MRNQLASAVLSFASCGKVRKEEREKKKLVMQPQNKILCVLLYTNLRYRHIYTNNTYWSVCILDKSQFCDFGLSHLYW